MILPIIIGSIPFILLIFAMRDGWDALGYIFSLKKAFLSSRKKQELQQYLQAISYYRNLSPKGKEAFFDRVLRFMFSKEFEGKRGLVVTDQMKVMISAAAVQLTFGLKNYKLTHLANIHIYPEIFTGPGRREYKGMTTSMGYMSFSWEDFKAGYASDTDRYNLGLHEMSHALHLTLVVNSDVDKRFSSYFDEWQEIASKEFDKMQHANPTFLREYGGTNKSEFFAVCIEHFFEAAEEFRAMLPDVYNHLAVLLNQNPLNIYNDYVLDKEFIERANKDSSYIPLPEKIKRKFKYSNWHWSLTLIFVGISGGIISLVYLYSKTIVPIPVLILIYLLCVGAGWMQKEYFKKREILEGRPFIFYITAGFAPILMAIVLWLNYLVPVSEPWTETYKVTGYEKVHSTKGGRRRSRTTLRRVLIGYRLQLENDAYYFTPAVRFMGTNYAHTGMIGYRFHRGLFGMKVHEASFYPGGEDQQYELPDEE